MKNYQYKSLLFAGALTLLSSCGTDFLEVDPYGKSDASKYYQTEGEVSMGLNAAYDLLYADQFFGWSSPTFIKVLPGDDTNCGGGGESDQPQYQNLDIFNWSTENQAIKAFYQINYFGIYRCNQLINNAATTSPTMKRMVAEAKFLRAYYFFELTVAYGGVPLRLTAAANINEGLPRSPQSAVYAQIEKDLNEAIAALPNKSALVGADRFRASKQTAQALLGKSQLYQKKYAEAAATLQLVINTEGTEVGLTPIFSDISKQVSEFGAESLLEASFASENRNWGNASWDRNANDNRHIQLQGPRDGWNGGTSGINGGWGFNPPTRKLYDAFEANDPRRLNTVIDTLELKSIYNGSFIKGWQTEGCIRTKFTTFASETTGANGATPELNYGTNWRLIRYADVLLLAAESYNKSGNDAKALECINKVRTRAGAPTITATGTALFNAIVHERFVELAYEGHRFWDLVRWDLADQELRSRGFVKGKHEHFPIPLDEMKGNSGLTPADQNPGY